MQHSTSTHFKTKEHIWHKVLFGRQNAQWKNPTMQLGSLPLNSFIEHKAWLSSLLSCLLQRDAAGPLPQNPPEVDGHGITAS